jgi:4-hydroxybenzoate polyprenyltransferase
MNGSPGRYESVFIRLTRIREWWVLSLGMILFAFLPYVYRINDTLTMKQFVAIFTTPPLYLAIAVVFTAQMFLFAGNDYYDRHVDALCPKKKKRNHVSNGRVRPWEVKLLLALTTLGALAFSFAFGWMALGFTAFSLFIFFFYTAEPLRFKNKIGLDVISHGALINTFPFFFCIVALRDFAASPIYLLSIFMMRSVMVQLLQEVRDYDIDRKVEKNTVVAIGQKAAVRLIFTIYLAMGIVTGLLLASYQLFGFGINMFHLVIFFMWVVYAPTFITLLRIKNYRSYIDSLWVGNGQTNRDTGIRVGGSFSTYLVLLYFVLM